MKRLMLLMFSLCVSICFCGNVNAQTAPSCDQVGQYIYESTGGDKGHALIPYLDGPPSILRPYETALAEFWMVDPEDKKMSLKWLSGLEQWANQCRDFLESSGHESYNAMSSFAFYIDQLKHQTERDQKDQAYRVSLNNEDVPQCTSAELIQQVKKTVLNSPAGRTRGLRLLEIENIKDISKFDANQIKRTCSGKGDFNGGERPITFTARLLDAKAGNFIIGAKWYEPGSTVLPTYGDDNTEGDGNMNNDFCAEFGGAYCH